MTSSERDKAEATFAALQGKTVPRGPNKVVPEGDEATRLRKARRAAAEAEMQAAKANRERIAASQGTGLPRRVPSHPGRPK